MSKGTTTIPSTHKILPLGPVSAPAMAIPARVKISSDVVILSNVPHGARNVTSCSMLIRSLKPNSMVQQCSVPVFAGVGSQNNTLVCKIDYSICRLFATEKARGAVKEPGVESTEARQNGVQSVR
jgi:hypothetical protein